VKEINHSIIADSKLQVGSINWKQNGPEDYNKQHDFLLGATDHFIHG
jgi:hypothetical protein